MAEFAPSSVVALLQTADLDWRVSTVTHLAAGRLNDNFLIEHEGGRAVLRVWKRASWEQAELELRALARLAEADFPGPRVLASPDGRVLFEAQGQPAALFAFIAGDGPSLAPGPESWKKIAEQMRVAREVAVLIARVDVALLNLGDVGHPESSYESKTIEYAAACRALDFGEHAKRAVEVVDAVVDLEAQLRSMALHDVLPVGLIHDDPGPWNMVFRGGHVAALLDFDMLHRDLLLYDLAHVVAQWPLMRPPDAPGPFFDPGMARETVAAYETVRPLSDAERRALAIAAPLQRAIYLLGALAHAGREGNPESVDGILGMFEILDTATDPGWRSAFG